MDRNVNSDFCPKLLSPKYMFCFDAEHICFMEIETFRFLLREKKVLKSWTFSPPLPRNLIDKYMFHSSLISSPILREIWAISSSFPLFVVSYPIPHSGDLEKFQVALHIQRCAQQ